jgi:glycosyltransferase involved in cell wall biosynthesis
MNIIKKIYHKCIPAELRDIRHQLTLEPFPRLFDYYKKKEEYKNDSKRNSPPSDFKHYFCVAAIIRNEADYIAEWLEYHLYVGIEKFYIYDNESDDNIKDILKPYIYRGVVEYYYLPGKKLELYKYNSKKERRCEQNRWVRSIQRRAYADAINRAKYNTFWITFIDIDEFIVPVTTKTIPEFLHDFENYAGVVLFWLMYGHSDHIKNNNQLVIERFQQHSPFHYDKNSQTKLIVNPRLVFSQRTHNAWFFEGKRAVNSNKVTAGLDGYSPQHDKIRLNHYHTKSFEEWLARRKGDLTAINNPLYIEEFNKEQSERNVIKDDTIMLKYIEPVKMALESAASHHLPYASIKISIIVPVYNAEKYLHRCLSSIVMQTFSDLELILVDDASTDNSPAICDKYSQNDSRIIVIHNKENHGCPQSRKIGLNRARGDFVLYIDSDDWIENAMLEKLYNKTQADNLDFVFCDYFSDNTPEKIAFPCPDRDSLLNQLLELKFTHNVWNKLIKREIYEKIEFPTASWAEDKAITIQTVYYAQKIGHLEEPLYHYCINKGSMAHNKDLEYKIINERYENWKLILSFLSQKYGENTIQFESALSNYTYKYVQLPFLKYKKIRDINKSFEVFPYSKKIKMSKVLFDTLHDFSFSILRFIYRKIRSCK